MNFLDWLRPGINIKRWILMGFMGMSVFVLGVSKMLLRGPVFDRYLLLYLYISIVGIALMYSGMKLGLKSALALVAGANPAIGAGKHSIKDLLYEQRLLVRGPRVVAIGGGTGLSTMIRGLKDYTSNISVIVTVADDGGGSGVLRESLKMLPPGDIRNCLVALANTEPVMEELLQYRFTEGELKGQSFGNLFLAAMNGISGNFEEAIKKMSDVLAVKGKVYPATLEDVMLNAELENGSKIRGESKIPVEASEQKSAIKRLYLSPDNPKPLDEALYEIENADCVIIGPGSLYTSILPNLLITEIMDKVKQSSALKIYVSNIMTQIGETDGYNLSHHLKALEKHCEGFNVDFVVANNGSIPEPFYTKYKNDGQRMVEADRANIMQKIGIVEEDLCYINEKGLLRHNAPKLAITIMKLILKYNYRRNRKNIMDYYYLSERIKDRQKEVS